MPRKDETRNPDQGVPEWTPPTEPEADPARPGPRGSANVVTKSDLVDLLTVRFDGNRKAATHALESVLDTITREVARGERVAITGFGSFEKRVREARWVRNPATGARMKAVKKAVPSFKPGAHLKDVVSGAKRLPQLTLSALEQANSVGPRLTAKKATTKKTATKKTATKKTATKKTATKKTATKKTSPSRPGASRSKEGG